MASRVSTGHAKVSGAKINKKAAREILNSKEAFDLTENAAIQIAEEINEEERGEFKSGRGTREGKTRAHSFVNTYDLHARNTANKDPDIFTRHIPSSFDIAPGKGAGGV